MAFWKNMQRSITEKNVDFLRKHWYDIGGVLAAIVGIGLFFFHTVLTNYQCVMWVSLITLFLHQLEEYRIVGTFPGMINRVMYRSALPDRYPLNTNTAFYVNVLVGWGTYLLAALVGERAIWLGIATTLVSFGNTIAHAVVFNIKGKTWYNAGLATSWLLFVPCVCVFFRTIHTEQLVTVPDYVIGVPLGMVLNVVGILKMIDWFADKNTPYMFEQRNLLLEDRIRKEKNS